MDDESQLGKDLAQVARLALESKDEDLRLFLARLVRKYRSRQPGTADLLTRLLEESPSSPVRRSPIERRDLPDQVGSGRAVLKSGFSDSSAEMPVLAEGVTAQLSTLLTEWRRAGDLRKQGLEPVSSAIFTGPPGVGKTMTARWIAASLGLPMYSLDLTAVMSSRLGQSGANLRSALDFAKSEPAVLFLDEIDSIAKRRADESDVGELKRLVTIMLQELDDWPSTSLLLAATNHPELVDPAIWRRFDLEVYFAMPSAVEVERAVELYLASDRETFAAYVPALSSFFSGRSFSSIERDLKALRKASALGAGAPSDLIERLVQGELDSLSRADRIEVAVELAKNGVSHHQVSRMTNVSRDTLRKRTRVEEAKSDG